MLCGVVGGVLLAKKRTASHKQVLHLSHCDPVCSFEVHPKEFVPATNKEIKTHAKNDEEPRCMFSQCERNKRHSCQSPNNYMYIQCAHVLSISVDGRHDVLQGNLPLAAHVGRVCGTLSELCQEQLCGNSLHVANNDDDDDDQEEEVERVHACMPKRRHWHI